MKIKHQSQKKQMENDEGVSRSFQTGHLERELQLVQLSATRRSCIAIFWVSLVSFAAITLYVASKRVFIVVYFVMGSVQKLLDTPSYGAGSTSEIQATFEVEPHSNIHQWPIPFSLHEATREKNLSEIVTLGNLEPVCMYSRWTLPVAVILKS
jgi:hypothetical protein